MTDFGIYIMTYPGDFHLSSVLVRTIRDVSPNIPIMIIPGEGFDEQDHPFDIPIMPKPPGFWGDIGFQDRDFWAFQGPFETFLYLDADTICTKSVDALAARMKAQKGNFIFVQPWKTDAEWQSYVGDPAHPRHKHFMRRFELSVGTGLLGDFDPDHDFYSYYPFNSGLFASRRMAITEDDLRDLNARERTFYAETLGITEWTWKSSQLFFRDQGRLNYLVRKLDIPIKPLAPEMVCTAGASGVHVTHEGVRSDAYDFHFIHWMGAMSPSPSLFCSGPLFRVFAYLWSAVGKTSGRWIGEGYDRLSECTGYSLWRHHLPGAGIRFSLANRVSWTWKDLGRTSRLFWRYVRQRISPKRLQEPNATPVARVADAGANSRDRA